ncbi:MAG: c-type cytochrome [Saprospiraceae bacterium]|nr:c-type cytochrome [Saprospiraceae bacterium]
MNQQYFLPLMWLTLAGLITGLIMVNSHIQLAGNRLNPETQEALNKHLHRFAWMRHLVWIFVLLLFALGVLATYTHQEKRNQALLEKRQAVWPVFNPATLWIAPNAYLAETDAEAELIAYGRDLIVHTQDYFGKDGLLHSGAINELNCQSCHLDAGSKPFGNNYFAVQSTYPQMRARSGTLETVSKRINDCFQRSLNGQALDSTSREMNAMKAYIRWLGTGIPQGVKPKGVGLVEVPFLERAASPEIGRGVFMAKCASCHGADGQGLPIPPDGARKYPPLWGEGSYNEAAGLFRLSRFAGYVKANMPLGASFESPQLSDEEAWDLAAFVNSQPRPKHPFLGADWPDISKKPFDHPFGPYRDSFPEAQHKFGPFKPIVDFNKKK